MKLRLNWLHALLLAYLAYALIFIFQSSVVIGGRRWFLLLDDAMISMTYARNLAHGFGAVWFSGYEPVDGYTNPLWMLYMALWHWLPLAEGWMSLPLQLTGAALNCAMLVCVDRITAAMFATCMSTQHAPAPPAENDEQLARFIAVLFSAFYFPLNQWSLGGMEVGLLAFGICFAVCGAHACATGRGSLAWLLALLGLLTAIRMDAVVPAVIIVVWLAWLLPRRRVFILLAGLGSIGLFVGAQLFIQRFYYHDWLPNTYYLKLAGIPLTRRVVWGGYVLGHFLLHFGFWLFIPLALLLCTVRSRLLVLLVALVAGQAAYSVYVGGDAWEWWGGANRYLCVVMPLLFVLVACGLVLLVRGLAARSLAIRPRAGALCIALGLLGLVQINAYSTRPFNSLAEAALLAPPPEHESHIAMLRTALLLQRATQPSARIAVVWAGIIPYFSHRAPIDLLGKNDRVIAHGPNRPLLKPGVEFLATAPVPYCWPGHTKHDFAWSLRDPEPDVIQIFYGLRDAEEKTRRDYTPLELYEWYYLVKKDSALVDRQMLLGTP